MLCNIAMSSMQTTTAKQKTRDWIIPGMGKCVQHPCTPTHTITKKTRIITCSKYTPDRNKNNVYSTTYILLFIVLLKYRIGLLIYKILSRNAPTCLKQFFKSNKDMHTHSRRQAHHLHSMKRKSEFVYRTFVFQSTVIWNKIIENIKLM